MFRVCGFRGSVFQVYGFAYGVFEVRGFAVRGFGCEVSGSWFRDSGFL